MQLWIIWLRSNTILCSSLLFSLCFRRCDCRYNCGGVLAETNRSKKQWHSVCRIWMLYLHIARSGLFRRRIRSNIAVPEARTALWCGDVIHFLGFGSPATGRQDKSRANASSGILWNLRDLWPECACNICRQAFIGPRWRLLAQSFHSRNVRKICGAEYNDGANQDEFIWSTGSETWSLESLTRLLLLYSFRYPLGRCTTNRMPHLTVVGKCDI